MVQTIEACPKKSEYVMFKWFAIILAAVSTNNVAAEDRMRLELSVIKGNKELPKVLYIVPWKRLPNENVKQKLTLHTLFDGAFEPIDPESFRQEIENYKQFSR